MVVKTLLEILERYSLNNKKGVKLQFVGHKNGNIYADTVYHDTILVTPIADNGDELYHRQRYFTNPKFTNWEYRNAFHELVNRYNKMNYNKENNKGFIPLHFGVTDHVTLR